MKKTIIIEIEMVNSCFGLAAKFWKGGNSLEGMTDLKHVLDQMIRLKKNYNNYGIDVLFTAKQEA